jgi:hypothetical protein
VHNNITVIVLCGMIAQSILFAHEADNETFDRIRYKRVRTIHNCVKQNSQLRVRKLLISYASEITAEVLI